MTKLSKKVDFGTTLLAAFLVMLAAGTTVVACGDDNEGSRPSQQSPTSNDYTAGWKTIIDPQTNRQFRCAVIDTDYYGPSFWCYELNSP